MTRRRFAVFATLLAGLVFVLANLLVQPRLTWARYDLTENRLFTVSAGTRATLEDLSEPIELTFAYSGAVGQEYPAIRAYAERVRELLTAYRALSGGRLRIVEIDPRPFSEAEDVALAAGLTAVRTDQQDPLYLGIVGVNAVDDQLVIPFLAPERETSLEYDLTRMIARLNDPEPPTLAIVSSLQGMTGDGRESGYFVLRELAKSYRIVSLPDDFIEVPPDVDVVLAAHATGLSDAQWDKVDQFILAGGRALFLVDPAAKAAISGGVFNAGPRILRSDLGPLGDHWGIQLSDGVVADAANALPVEVRADDGRVSVVGQPLFFATPPALMSDEDLATSSLTRSINFGAPGALAIEPVDGLQATILVETSAAPSWISADFAAIDVDPSEVIRIYEAQEQSLPLAIRLTGRFTSAFPNGPPAPDVGDDPVRAELARAAAGDLSERRVEANAPGDVIIIADADILDDGFYVNPQVGEPIADNAAFVLNAIDNLAGGSSLVGLRSRAPSRRPMLRVDRLRAEAQERYFEQQARLESRLSESTRRLEELQEIGASGGFFSGDLDADLTEAERAELIRLREDIVQTREGLREIERDFRRGIDGLEARLKALNIWGGPMAVAIAAFLVWRRRGRSN